MSMRIQKSVYDVVVAVVADYSRMKKMLEKGNLTREQVATFTRKVAAVDNALIAVCSGECEEACIALRGDIASRRGFENCDSKVFYETKYIYNKRKFDAVKMIARMLNLI